MSKKLKLAIIGTGGIATNVHVPAWLEHPEVEIVALCDIVKEKADALAERLGVKHVYTDYRDVLAHGESEARICCRCDVHKIC